MDETSAEKRMDSVPPFSMRDLMAITLLSEAITAIADGNFYTAVKGMETAAQIIKLDHILGD